jgi:predicted O-methyltransferase YrrM
MNREAIIAQALSFKHGGMTRRELSKLFDLAAGKRVVELGAYVGMSTYVLASVAEAVTTVDLWPETWGHLGPEQEAIYESLRRDVPSAWGAFERNVLGSPVAERVKVVRAATETAAPRIRNGSADLLLVDADHRYEAVAADLAAYLRKVKPDGLVLLHDYAQSSWPGVAQAAAEAPLELVETVDALGVFRKR